MPISASNFVYIHKFLYIRYMYIFSHLDSYQKQAYSTQLNKVYMNHIWSVESLCQPTKCYTEEWDSLGQSIPSWFEHPSLALNSKCDNGRSLKDAITKPHVTNKHKKEKEKAPWWLDPSKFYNSLPMRKLKRTRDVVVHAALFAPSLETY